MPASSINVVVSDEFEIAAKECLTEAEYQALLLLLARDPMIGEKHPGIPGVLMLPWNKSGLTVIYSVGVLPDQPTTILLFTIVDSKTIGSDKSAIAAARKKMGKLITFGAGAAAKEIVKKICEWLGS